MANGLLKGALSGMAVGVIVAAGISVLSIPREDAAPAMPLPRTSSETAGAEETPPPPPAAPAVQPAPEQAATPETPPEAAAPAEQSTGGDTSPAAETTNVAPAEPPAFEPPPPPESEPPAEVQPAPAVPASGSDAPLPDAAIPAAAPPAPDAPSPVEPIPPEPQPAAAPAPQRPRIAILLLDSPEVPDLAERIGAMSFPVGVALDAGAAQDAVRLSAAGAEVLALDQGDERPDIAGATARLRLEAGAPLLLRADGASLDVALIASGQEEPVTRPLDRALYRAAQSGAAAIVLHPTEEGLRDLGDWLARTDVEVVPLSALER